MHANQLSQLLLQVSLLSSENSPAFAPPTEISRSHYGQVSQAIQDPNEERYMQGSYAQNDVIPFPNKEPVSLSPVQPASEGWSFFGFLWFCVKMIMLFIILIIVGSFLFALAVCLSIFTFCGAIWDTVITRRNEEDEPDEPDEEDESSSTPPG